MSSIRPLKNKLFTNKKDAQNNATMNYVYTDYLGSWLKITNNAGAVTDSYSYDAWGRPRDPDTWQILEIDITDALVNRNTTQPRFDRGFTGHEHMTNFGLINMNGRLYDPYLQRFLSPDNVVQSPGNAQNYNRYSYCLNNPLMYVDPTGWNNDDPDGKGDDEDSGGSGSTDSNGDIGDNPGFPDATYRMLEYAWDSGEGEYAGEELREAVLETEHTFSITIPGGIFFTFAHFTGMGKAIMPGTNGNECGAIQFTFKWTEYGYYSNGNTKLTGEQQNDEEGQLGKIMIYYSNSADRLTVSEYTIRTLRNIMKEASISSLSITSTTRSPQDQVRIMFNNIKKYGVDKQKKLYGPSGKKVIDLYPNKSLMLNKILEVGPSKVSRHCGNPSIINVIDIDPGSISNIDAFKRAIMNNPAINVFFYPPRDPSFHLEIPQP